MFTAMVDVLREMNTYRETAAHDAFYAEAKAERDTIRRLQMKIDSALIDLEETR
jgi:cell division FtsZ-interacting protein ZapD